MKLYNRSKLSPASLLPILRVARRFGGARGQVPVTIGRGSTYQTSGKAWPCRRIRIKRRWVRCDGGCIEISPLIDKRADPIWAARSFLETAIHEFRHIGDFQLDPFKTFMPWARRPAAGKGGRGAYQRKPQEIRADNAIWEANEKMRRNGRLRRRVDALVVALGVEIERCCKDSGGIVS